MCLILSKTFYLSLNLLFYLQDPLILVTLNNFQNNILFFINNKIKKLYQGSQRVGVSHHSSTSAEESCHLFVWRQCDVLAP